MKNLNVTFVVIVCACTSFASVASASYMEYNGVGLARRVKVHAKGLLADGKVVPAGQLNINYEGEDYEAYCVDLDHYAESGEVTPLGVDSLNNGDLVAFFHDTYASDADTSLEAAALSVAIWEVIYETEGMFDTRKGYFSISSNKAVAKEANKLLGTLPGSYTSDSGLVVLHSDCLQDVLTVPEPGTLILLGLGGVGILLKRRAHR